MAGTATRVRRRSTTHLRCPKPPVNRGGSPLNSDLPRSRVGCRVAGPRRPVISFGAI
jgi:hypothetical protein